MAKTPEEKKAYAKAWYAKNREKTADERRIKQEAKAAERPIRQELRKERKRAYAKAWYAQNRLAERARYAKNKDKYNAAQRAKYQLEQAKTADERKLKRQAIKEQQAAERLIKQQLKHEKIEAMARRGEKHGRARRTATDVLSIRKWAAEYLQRNEIPPYTKKATELSMNEATIRDIVNRRTWTHIPPAPETQIEPA